jgi:hypothetical protein
LADHNIENTDYNVEYTALEKHTCAACGGKAEWHPTKQRLTCPYCGTVSPYEVDRDTGKIQEIDLVKTLREMPDSLRGWKADKKSVKCQSCHAVSVFEPEKVGQNCEFCGSPELVDYEEIKAPIRPQSLLPFRISETDVRSSVRRWYSGKWLAPGKLSRQALVDTVKGIYLPYWTFDAQVYCRWEAEAGYYYYTTRTYRDRNGRMQQQRVRKVRWEFSSGSISHFFDDEPIPGGRGIDLDLLKRIEPFPTTDLLPYDTAYLSGFVIEHYQVVLIDAAREARERMNQQLYQLCRQEVPGDTFRNLQIFPVFSGETFKHILVPVWFLAYDYGRKSYQVLVNGSTGKIAGRYPKSFWKILLLVILVLAAILILLLIGN